MNEVNIDGILVPKLPLGNAPGLAKLRLGPGSRGGAGFPADRLDGGQCPPYIFSAKGPFT
jgi:hypothetical protein